MEMTQMNHPGYRCPSQCVTESIVTCSDTGPE